MLKQTGKTTRTVPTQISRGCAVLFGLPFLLGGLAVTGVGLWETSGSLRARFWEEHPCTVLEADLKHSDESSKATARFAYRWQGIDYQSEKVSFGIASDNIGSFQGQTAAALRAAKGKPDGFLCWVNPRDPGEAVLFRDTRWEIQLFLIPFMTIFPLLGIGVMLGGGRDYTKQRQLQESNEDTPWLWRRDWAEGHCREDAGVSASQFIGMGSWVVVILGIVFGSMFLTDTWTKGRMIGAGISGVLFVLCARLLYFYGRAIQRFGVLSFVPDELPLQRGRPLRGVIHLPAPMSTTRGCRARVEVTDTLKDSDSTHSKSLRRIPVTVEATHRSIVIHADLPADLPASRAPHDSLGVQWKLIIKGPDGISGTFELPVYLPQ